MNMTTRFLMAVLFLFSLPQACLADAASPADIYNAPGEYLSPDGSCRAVLEVNGMGGFLTLQAGDRNYPSVDDVNGIAWLDDGLLVYTVSPIYGKSGLYLFGCETGLTAKLLPRPYSTSGAEYFELFAVDIGSTFAIWYYYAPDVDSVDFDNFRVRENLKSFILNLSEDSKLLTAPPRQ